LHNEDQTKNDHEEVIAMLAIVTMVGSSVISQTIQRGPSSWSGYVKRGRVTVRAGGSAWSVNGISVSHRQEIYASTDAARYVLSRLKGKMCPASEIAPNAGSLQFKVKKRKDSTRIVWVCETHLRFIESEAYAAALALLANWGSLNCS
jgi:hypothetical protein